MTGPAHEQAIAEVAAMFRGLPEGVTPDEITAQAARGVELAAPHLPEADHPHATHLVKVFGHLAANHYLNAQEEIVQRWEADQELLVAQFALGALHVLNSTTLASLLVSQGVVLRSSKAPNPVHVLASRYGIANHRLADHLSRTKYALWQQEPEFAMAIYLSKGTAQSGAKKAQKLDKIAFPLPESESIHTAAGRNNIRTRLVQQLQSGASLRATAEQIGISQVTAVVLKKEARATGVDLTTGPGNRSQIQGDELLQVATERVVHGKPMSEVAAAHGVKPGVIAHAMGRARELWRQKIAEAPCVYRPELIDFTESNRRVQMRRPEKPRPRTYASPRMQYLQSLHPVDVLAHYAESNSTKVTADGLDISLRKVITMLKEARKMVSDNPYVFTPALVAAATGRKQSTVPNERVSATKSSRPAKKSAPSRRRPKAVTPPVPLLPTQSPEEREAELERLRLRAQALQYATILQMTPAQLAHLPQVAGDQELAQMLKADAVTFFEQHPHLRSDGSGSDVPTTE